MVVGAFQGLGEPRHGVDGVHLAGLQERGDGRPCSAAAIISCEQAVLSRDGLRPDGALGDVGVEFDQAIDAEALEDFPSGYGIAQGSASFDFPDTRGRVFCQRENNLAMIGTATA